MEICKVCGKEFKKVTDSHIKTHKMSRKEYEILVSDNDIEEFEEITDISKVVPEVAKPESKVNKIFDGKDRQYSDRPLSDFLNKYSINEKDLTGLVLKYTTGSSLPISQQIEKKTKEAENAATKLAGPQRLEVYSISETDALVKNHGYTCETCKRVNGRKIWVLSK